MYFKNRTIDDVKARLIDSLNYHTQSLEKWEGVTLAKKKNGEEFVNVAQALTGARVVREYGWIRLQVVLTGRPSGMWCDDMHITHDNENGERVIDDADAIRAKIEGRKEYHKEYIAKLEYQLSVAEKAFNDYRKAIADAEDALLAICDKKENIGHSTLYYAITETR